MTKTISKWHWSTHKPLLNVLIEIVAPELIVEFGCGFHSTPIFLNSSAEKIYLIENDQSWLDHVISNSKFDNRCQTLLHELGPDISLGTFFKELSTDQISKITDFYLNFKKEISSNTSKNKLLFVDQYTCCRNLSINLLGDNFNMIVYHDAETPEWYEYNFDDYLLDQYDHYLLKTPRSWTGCFIKKDLNLDLTLNEKIKPHIEAYCHEVGLKLRAMGLEKTT
jgi:hypothetical protein